MGRLLQIRVGAWTYDEDEVLRAWPRLTALVWPELDRWAPPGIRHGVTELAEYLPDALRFGDVPEAEKKELLPGALQVAALLEAMRSALAEWEPRKANHISDQLEEALDALERKAPESWLERKQ